MKPTSDPIPVTEARRQIAEIVGRAQHGAQRTILTKHGTPVAAVAPIGDLERLRQWDELESGALVRETVELAASREAVWESLVGHGVMAWWPDAVVPDWVGGLVVVGPGVEAEAEVVEVAEFTWLVLRWSEASWPTPAAVRFVLHDEGVTTRVELTLAGLPVAEVERQRAIWLTRLTAWQSLWRC